MSIGEFENAFSSSNDTTPASALRRRRFLPKSDSLGVIVALEEELISILGSVRSLERFIFGRVCLASGHLMRALRCARNDSISFNKSWKAFPMLLNKDLNPDTSLLGSTFGTLGSLARFGLRPKMRRIDIISPFTVESLPGNMRDNTDARYTGWSDGNKRNSNPFVMSSYMNKNPRPFFLPDSRNPPFEKAWLRNDTALSPIIACPCAVIGRL
mmetsp:Transcript_3036/g.4793  ORF Transcript_3036/g.4793 Transcript_3036/m.4793 type:complete len:213 (-) Transcript_3036:1859-2497(-)